MIIIHLCDPAGVQPRLIVDGNNACGSPDSFAVLPAVR